MSVAEYQNRVDLELARLADRLTPVPSLQQACRYALLSPGKRVRPVLSLAIADAIGAGQDVMPSALSVELFHAASLVVDDLPCMDDDNERRGQPSVHRKFGEAVALLVSYSLIAEGYAGIYRNAQGLGESGVSGERAALEVLGCAAHNTGVFGVVGGQLLDLHPPSRDSSLLQKVLAMKTGSLFEISFVSGWLFGGGALKLLPVVKSVAQQFGLAFQVADDFGDFQEDAARSTGVNLVVDCGQSEALRIFENSSRLYRKGLVDLGLQSSILVSAMVQLEGAVSSAVG
jgi:geranylgeranyl diphosphate synthase type II